MRILLFSLLTTALAGADLAPTGTLRAAFLGDNPVQGHVDEKTGASTGPVADLVRELAARLKIPYKLLPEPDARHVMDRVKEHGADIGFLAWDAPRAVEVDYTGPYLLMLNSYVVRADSPIRKSADADREGVRIGGVKGQTQEIYLNETLKHARVQPFVKQPPTPDLERMLTAGELDAFALNRQRAEDLVRGSPKLRVLPDDFLKAEQSVVVSKGNAAAVVELNRFLEDVLKSGLVKKSIEQAKIAGVEAAPVPLKPAKGK